MSQYGGGITLDFWTDDFKKNPYLAITAHFIDDNWQLKNALVGIFPWDPSTSQTGNNILYFLRKKLTKFGIYDEAGQGKVVFVTDEGSNLKAALARENRLNCCAHVLNTVFKTVFDKDDQTRSDFLSLDACQTLVNHIRQSHMNARLPKAITMYVATRWHSKIDMIESILANWNDVEELLIERHETRFLDDVEKGELEMLLVLLKPFKEAILQLETSTAYPSLPAVALVYQKLLNSLSPSIDDLRSVAAVKVKLLSVLNRKLIIDPMYLLATTLHPSYRAMNIPFITASSKRAAYYEIRRAMNLANEFMDGSTLTDENGVNRETVQNRRPRLAVDAFLDEFCIPTEHHMQSELESYLQGNIISVSFSDILDWWKTNELAYPKVASLARKYLAIPATSAASESAFRYAGLTVTDLRNGLAPNTVSTLLFICHNDGLF